MSPRRSLGIVLIFGMFAAGCGVGLHSETDHERATPYLANVSIGPIAVRAVRIILANTPAGGTTTSSPAFLSATLVNTSDTAETLTGASVGGVSVQAVGASGVNLTLPPQQTVQLGEPDLGLTGPALSVGALPTPLAVGTTQQVTFTFASAGTTTLFAPVISADDVGTTASAAPVSASG